MTFPFKTLMRGGVTSPANTAFEGMIKNVSVIGAEAGKYYQIAYYQNGAAIGGVNAYGMIIKEFDAATFSSIGTAVRIQDLPTTGPYIVRYGGIQKVIINPPARPNICIELTVDGDNLPPFGTPINANDSSIRDGWSTIIDPICYKACPNGKYGPMHIEADGVAQKISFVWDHGADMLRVTMRPNGKNSLFNMRSVEIAPSGPINSAAWTTISSTETDWFPPLTIKSNTEPLDSAASSIDTGGNHGSDGSSGGSVTARMIEWSCNIDGRELGTGFIGSAERVVISWTNELMAWNTWSIPRYVLRQFFSITVTPGSIEIWSDHEKLEDIDVQKDNGPQMVSDGYADYYYYGGCLESRKLRTETGTSGNRVDYPNAWATVLRHPLYGFQTSWVDRSYGAGDAEFVATNAALMRKGTSTNHKQYHAIVAGMSMPVPDGGYRWHGGYVWSPITMVDGDLDSAFILNDRQKPYLAYAFLSAGSGQITLPMAYSGLSVGTKTVGSRNRVHVLSGAVDYQKETIV